MTYRTTTAERVRKHRRQSLSLRDDPAEREMLDWLDEVADRDDWT